MDNRHIGRLVALGVAGLLSLTILLSSYYTISPSERGFVRMWGTTTTTTPIGPGLHFKWPLITSLDTLQISQTSLKVDDFNVVTIDNQQVTLGVNIQYKVPEGQVYHLLYEVGRSGSGDIDEPIRAIIHDRVSRIFSSKNTNSISGDREKIQEATQAFVGEALSHNFGIELVSLQISKLQFSDSFQQSNNVAVLAKNKAIQEENNLKVFGYQAQQKVIESQGERDQQIASAEGKNRAAILNAEAIAKSTELQADANAHATLVRVDADAKALLTQANADKQAAALRGSGDASALKALVDAIGGPQNYIDKIKAEAQKQWTGGVPQIVSSDKASAMMPLMFPGQPITK